MITIPHILMALCFIFAVIIIIRKVKDFKQKQRKKQMKNNHASVQAGNKKTSKDYFDSILDETLKP